MASISREKNLNVELNFKIWGDWEKVVSVCRKVDVILEEVEPGEIGNDVTSDELEGLRNDWNSWRPCHGEEYSTDMRRKTAEQSTSTESELERNSEEAEEAMKKATDSTKKATKNAEEGKLDEAKDNFSEAVKETGRAVNSKVRNGVKKIEERIYESIILKVNSLYFDNSVLNAVLSKRLGADRDGKYEIILHSNNPNLRVLLAEKLGSDCAR
ncbi:MAG: DUF5828 family protein [Candidatus Hadarchaeota archaeon]